MSNTCMVARLTLEVIDCVLCWFGSWAGICRGDGGGRGKGNKHKLTRIEENHELPTLFRQEGKPPTLSRVIQ